MMKSNGTSCESFGGRWSGFYTWKYPYIHAEQQKADAGTKELVKLVREWQTARPQKCRHKVWILRYFKRYALGRMPEKGICFFCVEAESWMTANPPRTC